MFGINILREWNNNYAFDIYYIPLLLNACTLFLITAKVTENFNFQKTPLPHEAVWKMLFPHSKTVYWIIKPTVAFQVEKVAFQLFLNTFVLQKSFFCF